MGKMATLKQAGKILRLFENTPSDRVQELITSGLLTDLRDAPDIGEIDRKAFQGVINPVSTILHINRATPFNPAKFMGKDEGGFSIWRGPADGDGLSGDEEQDVRSLALTEVDLSKVRLETRLCYKEPGITDEEKLLRLKAANHIRLDAKVFQTLWEHKDKIPESWKERVNGNIRFIFFDGTVLRIPNGGRYALFLCWLGDKWHWNCRWLGDGRDANDLSAVLAIAA
jgi:hypothetical protein